MRVLHVVESLHAFEGGPDAACGMAAAQRRAGADVTVFAPPDATGRVSLTSRLRDAGVPIVRGPRVGLRTALGRTIPSVLCDAIGQAEVVHLHGVWHPVLVLAARAAGRHGTPRVLTPHGMLTRWSLAIKPHKKRLFWTLLGRRTLGRCEAVHLTTPLEDRDTQIYLAGRRIIQPLGVMLDPMLQQSPTGYWTRPGATGVAADPVVAVLGRVHPGKGIDHLVEAFRRTPALSRVRLVVIGPHESQFGRELKRRAHQPDAAGGPIEFIGSLRPPRLYDALASADLFVLPSDHENFSLAAVEAMACGVATLLSDRVGIAAAAVQDGAVALVPRDPVGLGRAVTQWLEDAPARAILAARGREYVARHFAAERVARAWLKHYEALRPHDGDQ
jgi:glycosyltransferase involved in cell wall biosynthesis